jgi:Glycosyltransferase family 10 (fucosyltransferase) C-term
MDYLNQFGCILSFQEPWAMRHPNVIFHHPGLRWYYGLPFGEGEYVSWDRLAAAPPSEKTRIISTVCSEHTGKVTTHSNRVSFIQRLKDELPELDIFGHGMRTMVAKAEALDLYKYHIVVENHVFDHHLTEKMPDAFLGYCLPSYHDAPNADCYFPKESFIPIDINNYLRSRDIIRSHLADNEYADRLPHIIEARRKVLLEQNLFAIIDRMICAQETKITTATMGKVIRKRSTMRTKNPLVGIRSLTEKALVKTYLRFTNRSRHRQRGL